MHVRLLLLKHTQSKFKTVQLLLAHSWPAGQHLIQLSHLSYANLNHRFCRLSDERSAFCLNGLEIDLDELEALEQRVKAKKRLQNAQDNACTEIASTSKPPADANNEVDELDEYLKELQLRESSASHSVIEANHETIQTNTNSNSTNPSTNFAILLYWFLAILNLANATYCKHFALAHDLFLITPYLFALFVCSFWWWWRGWRQWWERWRR